jgi:hypothetical protein
VEEDWYPPIPGKPYEGVECLTQAPLPPMVCSQSVVRRTLEVLAADRPEERRFVHGHEMHELWRSVQSRRVRKNLLIALNTGPTIEPSHPCNLEDSLRPETLGHARLRESAEG